jgi:hypothetical protein
MVWVGLLKESFEVVCRRPRLTLVTAHGSRNAPPTRDACLLVVIIIVINRGCGSLSNDAYASSCYP